MYKYQGGKYGVVGLYTEQVYAIIPTLINFVFLLFADLLPLHLVIFLTFFSLVYVTFYKQVHV